MLSCLLVKLCSSLSFDYYKTKYYLGNKERSISNPISKTDNLTAHFLTHDTNHRQNFMNFLINPQNFNSPKMNTLSSAARISFYLQQCGASSALIEKLPVRSVRYISNCESNDVYLIRSCLSSPKCTHFHQNVHIFQPLSCYCTYCAKYLHERIYYPETILNSTYLLNYMIFVK